MAVKYEEYQKMLKEKEKNRTNIRLKHIDQIECLIDEKILRGFDIVTIDSSKYQINENLARSEIKRRYREAGWKKVRFEFDGHSEVTVYLVS